MFKPQELSIHVCKSKKNSFLIIISISRGWGITKIINNSLLLSSSLTKVFLPKSYLQFFSNMYLGFYKNYFYFLKLKGMGFKIIGYSKGLIFKFGYSHKLLFLKKQDIVFFYLGKQLLLIKSRCILLLKKNLVSLMKLKKRSSYKKKGIFYKGSILKVKLTSKKSKF